MAVLLTGATGSIGAYVLARLLRDDDEPVHARAKPVAIVNRGSAPNPRDITHDASRTHGFRGLLRRGI